MPERTVTITTPNGLHARPAALFVKAAAAHGPSITISKAGGTPVPAASILSVLSLQIGLGDEITISSHDDATEAGINELAELLATNLDA